MHSSSTRNGSLRQRIGTRLGQRPRRGRRRGAAAVVVGALASSSNLSCFDVRREGSVGEGAGDSLARFSTNMTCVKLLLLSLFLCSAGVKRPDMTLTHLVVASFIPSQRTLYFPRYYCRKLKDVVEQLGNPHEPSSLFLQKPIPPPPHPIQANLANNSMFSFPVDVEAAWGRPDVATGKLDPDAVGSPRKVEVVVRGNPVAEQPKKVDGGTGGTNEDAGQAAAAAMDESQ